MSEKKIAMLSSIPSWGSSWVYVLMFIKIAILAGEAFFDSAIGFLGLAVSAASLEAALFIFYKIAGLANVIEESSYMTFLRWIKVVDQETWEPVRAEVERKLACPLKWWYVAMACSVGVEAMAAAVWLCV